MSPENNAGKLSPGYILKWIVSLGVPLIITLIPLNEVFTYEIRTFLALSLLMILVCCFEFFNLIVPSVLLPTSYYIFAVAPAATAFGAWTQNVVWVVLGAFIMAVVFEEIGLLKRIAYWVILKAGGTYKKTVWSVLIAAIILSQITFGNAYVLMAALTYGVCRALKLKPGRESTILMIAGLLGSCATRGVIYTPSVLSLLNAGAQTILPDFELIWTDELFHCFPIFFFCFLFTFIMLLTVRKEPDANGKEHFQREYDELGNVTTEEKKAVIILAMLLIYLCTGTIHKIPMDYGFMIIPWFLFFPGIRVGTTEAIHKLNFPMIFFVVACLSIGTVAGALGIGQIVSGTLTPILKPLGTTAVICAMLLLGVTLNFLMTPLAFLSGFSGPVTQIAIDLGINPAGLLYTLNFASDLVFMPYEYVPYLIFYSFGVMPLKHFVSINAIKFVVFFIFLGVVMIPYWHLIGLL